MIAVGEELIVILTCVAVPSQPFVVSVTQNDVSDTAPDANGLPEEIESVRAISEYHIRAVPMAVRAAITSPWQYGAGEDAAGGGGVGKFSTT